MTGLIDLPPELITLIAQEVGGGELRKDVRNLTLCRKWYECSKEVFHSGRHLHDIRVYGCNVGRLADVGGYSGQRKLMHKNTRNLEIRVIGHWHDDNSEVEEFSLFQGDLEGAEKGAKERTELDNDPFIFGGRSERTSLIEWHTQVLNPRLYELLGDLGRFTYLESLTFEAIQGTENDGTPIERYLTSAVIGSLLSSLSVLTGLKSLTLDICCEINYNGQHIHMCEQLSRIIPRLESVRLRLVYICSRLFKIESDLQASDVRLRNIIVKLHLPQWPASLASMSSKPKECDPPSQGNSRTNRREDIIRAMQQYLVDLAAVRARSNRGDLSNPTAFEDPDILNTAAPQRDIDHGLELCRISYVEGYNIAAVDCLSMQIVCVPEEFFTYEDDGSPCWYEDEERLIFCGAFTFSDESSRAELPTPILRRNSN